MINLKNLIELLPPIFRDHDSYKVEGKGILERFLEICGEYLEDVITPDIENTLDITDIDKTDSIYLNYLWELFGEIPFANSNYINIGQWDRYYDGTLPKEELEVLSKNWLIPKEGTIVLPDTQVRKLLKYSLALLKTRGTKRFFETLFKIYGIDCKITGSSDEYKGIYANPTRLGSNYCNLDEITVDNTPSFDECVPVYIDISSNYFYSGSDKLLIVGKGYSYILGKRISTDVDTEYGVNLYNTNPDGKDLSDYDLNALEGFKAFRRSIEYMFEKYLPCNVKPVITYDGITPDDKVSIKLTYLSDYHLTKGFSDVILRVSVNSKWPGNTNKFQVSSDGRNWGDKVYPSGHIFNIPSSGNWYFRSMDNESVQEAITVSDLTMDNTVIPRLVPIALDSNTGVMNYSPVQYYFYNNHDQAMVDERYKVSLKLRLYRGDTYNPNEPINVVEVNSGDTYVLDESSNTLTLQTGEYTFAWADNPEVYIDLSIKDSKEPFNTDYTQTRYKGLNYGVSGTFTQVETYTDSDSVDQEYTLSRGTYGLYGALLDRIKGYTPSSGSTVNSNGNVVNILCTKDTTSNIKVTIDNLTPWAYSIDENTGDIEPVELNKVDIWVNSSMFTYYPLLSSTTFSDHWVKDPVGFSPTAAYRNELLQLGRHFKFINQSRFFRMNTISIKKGETIDLTDMLSRDPHVFGTGVFGGIILLHPNTNELLEKGISPNYDDSDYWSNFLVVVIPPVRYYKKDGGDLPGYTELSRYLQNITDNSNSRIFNRLLPSDSDRPTEPYSVYASTIPEGFENYSKPYYYKYLNLTTQRDINGPNKLTIEPVDYHKGSQTSPWLSTTNYLLLNLSGYNSNNLVHIATYNPNGYLLRENSYDINTKGLKNLYTDNLLVIALDILVPFTNTQYVIRRNYQREKEDGLYIRIMNEIPSLTIGGFYPWPTVAEEILVGRTPFHDNVININTCYTELSGESSNIVSNTTVLPARFQFVMYQNRIEWDMDYYIIDTYGNKYYPNTTYEIRDIGTYRFYVVPNTNINFSDSDEVGEDRGRYEVTIVNTVKDDNPVKVELKLSNPEVILTSNHRPASTVVSILCDQLLPQSYLDTIYIAKATIVDGVITELQLTDDTNFKDNIFSVYDNSNRTYYLVAVIPSVAPKSSSLPLPVSSYSIISEPVEFKVINPKIQEEDYE